MRKWLTGAVMLALVAMAGAWLLWPTTPLPAAGQPGSFASERKPTGGEAVAVAVPFDGARAMGYLRDLCALGPRISGSPAMLKQQEVLEKHFRDRGGRVTWQKFTAKQFSKPNAPVAMANLIVQFHPERQRRIIWCSHYDTRPIADQEPDPRKWHEPFASANDGTSGVALLMELAHHVKDLPGTVGIDFVLFDGEEYIFDNRKGADKYFFGSEHFASEYRRQPPSYRYVGAALLDLCAGKDARFPMEGHSLLQSGALTDELWTLAANVGAKPFVKEYGQSVLDDHLALIHAGIPAVDIIDFDYAHWHRLSDTPDQCSPETMAHVARVLTGWAKRAK